MNGVQLLNLMLWVAFIVCIWDMPIGHFFITMIIVWAYGITEKWLGQDEKK
jgi:hypothetical protein